MKEGIERGLVAEKYEEEKKRRGEDILLALN